jgi:hypothetical protein
MLELTIKGDSVSELRAHAVYIATHLLTDDELQEILDGRKQYASRRERKETPPAATT